MWVFCLFCFWPLLCRTYFHFPYYEYLCFTKKNFANQLSSSKWQCRQYDKSWDLPNLLGSHPLTVLALSTSTSTLRPSIFLPSACLYAAVSQKSRETLTFMFFLKEKNFWWEKKLLLNISSTPTLNCAFEFSTRDTKYLIIFLKYSCFLCTAYVQLS